MLDFLKRFGLGVVYVLSSPFLIAFLLLWLLYNIVIFFIELFRSITSFFKGGKFFKEFNEDVEAKKILSSNPTSNIQVTRNDSLTSNALNIASIDEITDGGNK